MTPQLRLIGLADTPDKITIVLLARSGDLIGRFEMTQPQELPDTVLWKGRVLFTLFEEDSHPGVIYNLDDDELAYIEANTLLVE